MEYRNLEEIIDDCKNLGIQIDEKDISFCFLNNHYQNSELTYSVIFGRTDRDTAEEYKNSDAIKTLNNIINERYIQKEIERKAEALNVSNLEDTLIKKSKIDEEDDISFDKNKKGMIQLLKSIKKAVSEKKMDIKDALKIEADVRIKLNDKFGATDNDDSNIIVVKQKFTGVCPYCGHEI